MKTKSSNFEKKRSHFEKKFKFEKKVQILKKRSNFEKKPNLKNYFITKIFNFRPNFAAFLKKRAAEEQEHAEIFANFQLERGADVNFMVIFYQNFTKFLILSTCSQFQWLVIL